MPSRDYVWCLVCSRVRGGGSESPRAAPFCAVPCRAVPPWGGGGKEALCHGIRVKGHLIAASKSEATGTETLEASGLYKAEWFVHRDSGVPS